MFQGMNFSVTIRVVAALLVLAAGNVRADLTILQEISSPDGKATTVRVLAISREPIADSDFKVPDGYREIEMPQIPGMPAGR